MNDKMSLEQVEELVLDMEVKEASAITIVPGGRQDGLDYGAAVVEFIKLDEDTVVYRYSDDSLDGNWEMGSVEDLYDEIDMRFESFQEFQA